MKITVRLEREEDGRWFGQVSELPCVLAYGATRDDAAKAAQILAMRVMADKLEQREIDAQTIVISSEQE